MTQLKPGSKLHQPIRVWKNHFPAEFSISSVPSPSMVTANTAHSSLGGYKALNLLYPACHHTCIQPSIYCLLLIFTTGSPSPDVSPLPGRQLAKTVFAGSYNNDTILTQSVTPGTWDTHQLYRSFTLTSLGIKYLLPPFTT